MNREEMSQLVAGKVALKQISPSEVNPSDLIQPYRGMVEYALENQDWTLNDLIMHVNYYAVEQATATAEAVNGVPADWPQLLHKLAVMDDVGVRLQDRGKRLMKGEDVEPAEIIEAAHLLAGHDRTLALAGEVEPDADPFVKSYWNPVDTWIGGLPKSGLTVVGAPPGTGKTWLLARLAIEAARAGKKSLIFSMEMTSSQLAVRLAQMEPDFTQEQLNHIMLIDQILTPMGVSSMASLIPEQNKPHFIGIDFAELMMSDKQEMSEGTMAHVYQTLARLAKHLEIPVVLLSQLSRSYTDGLPEITHLRYTGMAEALASLILLIYNRRAVFAKQDSGGALPDVPGKAYVIVGKSRFGNRAQKGGRFAMQLDWEGKTGWGTHQGVIKPL